jgi:hypothetical protein
MTTIDFESLVKEHDNQDKHNIEEVISDLKNAGATQIQSVKALMTALGIPLKEADHLVLNSIAWKETKGDVEKFRNDFGEFLEKLE